MAPGFVLVRLEPGPAEHYFGITAAPMAVVADWYGRVTVPNLNLRGDISSACSLLKRILDEFDHKQAAVPPYEPPDWAKPLVQKGSADAMADLLGRIHPATGRPSSKVTFKQFCEVYAALDTMADLLAFCENYNAALLTRVPVWGKDYKGYAEERLLLEEMSCHANDSVKFSALKTWGGFAPLSEAAFLVKRAERKAENCKNPNVLYIQCLTALGTLTSRFPADDPKGCGADLKALLAALPLLTSALDREQRNNGACTVAGNSIISFIKATGAPEALEALMHTVGGPPIESDFVKGMAEKFATKWAGDLRKLTGQQFGPSFDEWKAWYTANEAKLFYDRDSSTFILDERAAKARRKKLGQ